MENRGQLYSIALVSTFLILFLIIFSSTASAATVKKTPFQITETQITTHKSAQLPAINDNRIVWEDDRNGNWDIYMYDLSTHKETQITTDKSDQQEPAIYGNRIVWQDNRNGGPQIYMYDISTHKETQISTNDVWASSPDIYDDIIVWTDASSWQEKGDIYIYDLSTHKKTDITMSGSASNPAIFGNKIVWEDNRDIYTYDISTNPVLH